MLNGFLRRVEAELIQRVAGSQGGKTQRHVQKCPVLTLEACQHSAEGQCVKDDIDPLGDSRLAATLFPGLLVRLVSVGNTTKLLPDQVQIRI